jgi:hypothetical protein
MVQTHSNYGERKKVVRERECKGNDASWYPAMSDEGMRISEIAVGSGKKEGIR